TAHGAAFGLHRLPSAAVKRGAVLRVQTLRAEARVRPVIESHFERLERLPRLPVLLRDNCYAVWNRHDINYTGQIDHRRFIEARDRAAVRRALFHRRVNHAGHAEVEAEDGAPVELRGQLNAPERFAEQLPFAFRFRSRLRGRDYFRRVFGNFAERQAAPARFVDDFAILREAFIGFDAPAAGRRRDQHLARRGAHRPQQLKKSGRALAVAGELPVDAWVAVRGPGRRK